MKMGYLYTILFYSVVRKIKIMKVGSKWKELEHTIH